MNDFQPTDIHPIGPDYWRSLAERREVLKAQAAEGRNLAAMGADDEAGDCADEAGPLWFQVMEKHRVLLAVALTAAAVGASAWLPMGWAA